MTKTIILKLNGQYVHPRSNLSMLCSKIAFELLGAWHVTKPVKAVVLPTQVRLTVSTDYLPRSARFFISLAYDELYYRYFGERDFWREMYSEMDEFLFPIFESKESAEVGIYVQLKPYQPKPKTKRGH